MTSGQQFPEIPEFEIVQRVGRGGFSSVYQATDHFGGSVALKVLRLDLTEDQGRDRFERECRAMGRLRDVPGIVPVYRTTYATDGRPVIVMEYCGGGSLADRLKSDGPLSPDEVARIGTQIAQALAVAHASQIFHRDIKPENVLRSDSGHYALSDFGIAAADGYRGSTETAATLTPPHAPPERFSGEWDEPGSEVAGDIYSLGSTLYMMLTGRAPFGTSRDGGIAALARRVTSDPPMPIDRPDVPPQLSAAILRALAKEPRDRYADAASFAAALAPTRSSHASTTKAPAVGIAPMPEPSAVTQRPDAPPDLPGVVPPGDKQRRRSPVLVGAALLASVALIIGLVVAVSGGDDSSGSTNKTEALGAHAVRWVEPQGPVSARRSWQFDRADGSSLRGVLDATRVAGEDPRGAALVEFVPAELTTKPDQIKWSTEPTSIEAVPAPVASPGKAIAADVAGAVVRFALPTNEDRLHVTYRVTTDPGPATEDRLAALNQARTSFKQYACGLPKGCGGIPITESIQFFSGPVTIGTDQHFAAAAALIGKNSDGSILEPGKVSGAKWSIARSTPEGAATVDPSGDVVGVAPGFVTIRAEIRDVPPAELPVWIIDGKVAVVNKVAIVTGPTQIVDGKVTAGAPSFSAEVTDSEGKPVVGAAVTWTVIPSSIGSVVNGYFKATVAPGETKNATVRATVVNTLGRSISDSASLKVVATPNPPKDRDGDGFIDTVDGCPDEFAPGTPNGCINRDGDGDGIPTPTDKCPNDRAPGTVDGCTPVNLDADGDGVPIPTDKCPTQREPRTADGCPRADLTIRNQSVSVIGTLVANQCVGFSVDVLNVGSAPSPNVKHGVLFAFSNSFSSASRNTLPWSEQWTTGIAAGGSRTQTTDAGRGNCPGDSSKWLVQSGTFTVHAWVDDTNGTGIIPEISDTNNYGSVTFTVP